MRPSVLAGGAAGLGAAGFAIYHGQQPSSEVYGPTIHHEPAAGRRIALTYDDGPNRPYTEELLELFARHGAHATFFQIGPYAQQHPELVREVKAAGHAIGNHTWTHPTMSLKSAAALREELSRCRGAVEAAGVTFSEVDGRALMRPPYGRRRPGTLRVLREQGYVPVLWSVTCWDWRREPFATERSITRHALKARDGDVILLHDGSNDAFGTDRSRSVAATRHVLEQLGSQGFEFVTVPELVATARG